MLQLRALRARWADNPVASSPCGDGRRGSAPTRPQLPKRDAHPDVCTVFHNHRKLEVAVCGGVFRRSGVVITVLNRTRHHEPRPEVRTARWKRPGWHGFSFHYLEESFECTLIFGFGSPRSLAWWACSPLTLSRTSGTRTSPQ